MNYEKPRLGANSPTAYKSRVPEEALRKYERAARVFFEELCRLHFDTDVKAVGARVVKQRGIPGNVRIIPEYEYDIAEVAVAEETRNAA